jgi:hypothetical protein
MKVKVTKLSKNDNSYRTPLYMLDGMPDGPKVGQRLLFTSSTHESGGIITSLVKNIEALDDNTLVIDTEFSVYQVELLEESGIPVGLVWGK